MIQVASLHYGVIFKKAFSQPDIFKAFVWLQGLEKVIEQGLKQGIEKGIDEGIKKGKLAIAQSMLEKGFDVNTIKEITGLSEL